MAPLYIRSRRGVVPAQSSSPRSVTREVYFPFGLPPPAAGTVQQPAGISLCMIVKDEERFLEACLRSVAGCVDEICIVDTGSTDRTVDIAAAFGARIEHRPWRNDFAWARNEALALATRRWILVLDADEELDPPSIEILRSLREVPAALAGLWVRCNNLSDDYKGTGVSSHALVRFFPNTERIRYLSPVHEFITLDGQTTGISAQTSPLSITHHGYLSEVVKSRNKSQRNLALVMAAAKDNPAEPFNWYNLGTTSLLCDDPDTAVAAFEKMRELVGNAARGFVPNALSQLADIYTDRGDYERAEAIAGESLAKAPRYANAHFALGRALAKAGRLPEARAAFEAAIDDAAHASRQFVVDDEVSIWKAQSEIGSSYGNEGNDVAALAWFDRALANRPKVIPVRMNRAKALERLGRLDEAEAMFAELAADEPGDAHCIDYINFLLRCGKRSESMAAIARALDVVTPRTRASLLVTQAKLAAQIGRTGDVRSLLEQAVAAYPGAADALEALEAHYAQAGERDSIERLHAEELHAPTSLAQDYQRRAALLVRTGRFDAAEDVAHAGIALTPADPGLRYVLATALVQRGERDAALDELDRVGSQGDIGLRATFLRGMVLADLARYEDAIAAIDVVIALAPHEVDARIARFRFVDALGRIDEAESTLRDALVLGDARIATELAAWLLAKGRYADARRVADFALATSR